MKHFWKELLLIADMVHDEFSVTSKILIGSIPQITYYTLLGGSYLITLKSFLESILWQH